MKKAVLKIYDYLCMHKGVLWFLMGAVIALFAVLSAGMKPQEDITAFLPGQDEYARISEAYSNIRAANMVMVTVSPRETDGEHSAGADKYMLMDAADSVAAFLVREDTGCVGRRTGKRRETCPFYHIEDRCGRDNGHRRLYRGEYGEIP